MPWGVIDEAAIDEARGLIGVDLRRDRMQWVRSATPDAIRHFAWGIGDDNPLWQDEGYAGSTRWGKVLAPGCFLYAVDYTIVAPKLQGVQWIYAGTDWTWYDVIRAGDDFTTNAQLVAVDEKSGKRFDRWVLQTGEVSYRLRDEGRLVGVARSTCARTPRGEELARTNGGSTGASPGATYTPEQLEQINESLLNETWRGADTLYWEDVEVGEQLTPIVKGPLTIMEIVAWYSATQGAEPYGGTHARVARYRERHHDYHVNGQTGARDYAARGHLEADTGKAVGMGGAYDVGPQRISWAGQMLSNWMGDDGFLHKLAVVLRRPNLVGDTIWWRGTVTAKDAAEGAATVTIELVAETQTGKVSATGSAVVLLPSHQYGAVELPLAQG